MPAGGGVRLVRQSPFLRFGVFSYRVGQLALGDQLAADGWDSVFFGDMFPQLSRGRNFGVGRSGGDEHDFLLKPPLHLQGIGKIAVIGNQAAHVVIVLIRDRESILHNPAAEINICTFFFPSPDCCPGIDALPPNDDPCSFHGLKVSGNDFNGWAVLFQGIQMRLLMPAGADGRLKYACKDENLLCGGIGDFIPHQPQEKFFNIQPSDSVLASNAVIEIQTINIKTDFRRVGCCHQSNEGREQKEGRLKKMPQRPKILGPPRAEPQVVNFILFIQYYSILLCQICLDKEEC